VQEQSQRGLWILAEIEFEGKAYIVNEDGFLEVFDSWDEGWVKYVMSQEGIKELTVDHKKVIQVIRDYYIKNGIAPMIRLLSKITELKLIYIYKLFPSGPAKGACKMAGLPKPTGCI
jgi:dissimilatory sulfite reductase related protein